MFSILLFIEHVLDLTFSEHVLDLTFSKHVLVLTISEPVLDLTFSEHVLDPLQLPGDLDEDVVHVLHSLLHYETLSHTH